MIQVKDLTKKYGEKLAVDSISFSVGEGEIVGFLGPNGAGKTTTMNILTGYISATGGTVKIGGHDILEQPEQAKSLMGFLPEAPPLYLDMTVEEYLRFVYKIKGAKLDREAHIGDICGMVGISHMRGRVIKNLSKGYRQRTGLAQALIGNPRVIVLDEPTVGLDPIQIVEIRNVIKDLGAKATIILSSHILAEVQAVCERVIVIDNGVIRADGSVEELSSSVSTNSKIVARIVGDEGEITGILRGLEKVKKVSVLPTGEDGARDYLVESLSGADVRGDIFTAMAASGHVILVQQPMNLNLEDIFLKLTTKEGQV